MSKKSRHIRVGFFRISNLENPSYFRNFEKNTYDFI